MNDIHIDEMVEILAAEHLIMDIGKAKEILKQYYDDKIANSWYVDDSALSESDDSLYFKSEAARLIYILVELDGRQRADKLGINLTHYKDLDKARKWRNELMKIIHPDKCSHPNAALAASKATEIFDNMTKGSK